MIGISQPVTNGLVGYWPFNGNANDKSGNASNGEVYGAQLVEDRFGNSNSAYLFDGLDDYIAISSPHQNYTNNIISISLWVNIYSFTNQSNNGYPGIIGQSSENIMNSNYHMWGIHVMSTGFTGTYIYKEDLSYYTLRVNTLDLNEWNHVVITADGEFIKMYFNSVLVKSVLIDNNFQLNSNSVIHIGKDSRYTSGSEFSGIIDDIAIYNIALTEDDINELYQGYIPNPTPQPEACQTLYCDGENIGIGTSDTKGYKLAVAGSILTEGVKVALQSSWPDYVFDEHYTLENLTDLEKYINENKHLPNIPSAEIVRESGYELSAMDAKLLEKIEGLTLYLIDQNKKIEGLKREIDFLKEENKSLKKPVKTE
jgi:hypothetical protein